MTDIVTEETAAAEGTPAEEAKVKPPKVAKLPHACLCSSYEVIDTDDENTAFSTGCEQTTFSTFAQGHDARLVSFLVDGYFDGYEIRQVIADSGVVIHPTPADAVRGVSEALVNKAVSATDNRQAKVNKKAEAKAAREERAAARKALAEEKAEQKAKAKAEAAGQKANAPKATGAEKVAGSAEGDQTPLAEGETRIKIGRWEYNATIDSELNATYVDGAGVTQTVNEDGYRVLGVPGV